MYKYLLTLLLSVFLGFALPVYSNLVKPVKIPAKIKTDTTTVHIRNFDAKQMGAYLRDKDFKYNKADVQGESLWDSFWHWFWEWINQKVFSSPGSQDFFRYFLLLAGAVFLLFIISKVSGLDKSFILRGSAKNINLPYSETLENIHDLNFDDEIEKAINNHNYRLAVRLLYLYSLKQLSDAGLINWQIEKTNSVYLYEIPEGEKRKLFGLLTRQFEYVWYGNFYIDAQAFQNISSLFKQLKQELR